MNIYDVISFKAKHGPAATADLLILAGPDNYDGDYDKTLADLIKEIETGVQ